MSLLVIINLLLVAIIGTAVVFIKETTPQVLMLGLFGFSLAVLFILYHAPDVAMAQGAVSGLIMPILILLAIAKVKKLNKQQ